jgi:hypothetical protein
MSARHFVLCPDLAPDRKDALGQDAQIPTADNRNGPEGHVRESYHGSQVVPLDLKAPLAATPYRDNAPVLLLLSPAPRGLCGRLYRQVGRRVSCR